MTRLQWGQVGERRYENGVDQGVLYIANNGVYDTGFAWNGLTTVTESPSGAESNKQYADNSVYLNLLSAEEFSATIEAFTYPKAFAQCDGTAILNGGVAITGQTRKSFGFSYRTLIGNDITPEAGFKIHLVYNALAAPSERANTTVNDSPEAQALSWECTTTPTPVGTIGGVVYKPTAHIIVDSTEVPVANMNALLDALYGTAGTSPRLPTPAEVVAMFAGALTSVEPTQPAFVAASGVITIPTVTGVQYKRGDTGANLAGGSTVTIPTSGATQVIKAVPTAGYQLAPNADDDWTFKRT